MVLGEGEKCKESSEPENPIGSSEDQFKRMLDELFLLNGVLNIGDYIPWIGGSWTCRGIVKDYVAKDMVDVLLQLAQVSNRDVKLSRTIVKAFTLRTYDMKSLWSSLKTAGTLKQAIRNRDITSSVMYQCIPKNTQRQAMESSATLSLYLVLFLASLAIFFKAINGGFLRRKKLNLPPGPKPWPVIGNLNLIGHLPHRSIHHLSLKYGPLMQLKFGSYPFIIASSAETAKQILKTQDLNFASRPKMAAGKYTTYNYSNITWSPYGAYWRQARKMCLMELFSARRLDSYEYIRVEEMRAMLRSLFAASGETILLKDHLSTVSLNVISRMVLGKKYTEESAAGNPIVTPEEFKRMLDELFLLNGVLNIGDYIPWIGFLDLQGYVRRMKKLSKKFDRFLEHVIDEHNERRRGVKDYVAKDMVDVLLQLADDPNLDVKLSKTSVKAFTQDLIAGGTESSAMTVEWAISELLKQPRIFEKVTEELDRVIGKDRWVEEKDIPHLPYVEAIMKEAMRMHPVAPLLVPRLAREDCSINGYDISSGTRALVNTWTIGRDPEIWDCPDQFYPERFLGKSIDVKGQDFEFLPFGSGRRMCPGYSLGLKVIELTLANLLHGFKWRLPDLMSQDELNMEEIFGLSTPRKVPLEAVIEPRLPTHVYNIC
ncbi:cytochrome P450 71A1-like protein [Cinnamomum micranthum f. kanehirae]|uniref:Cytochrome P450 71A1-like protein n=1 Tax=Cinnamomum micranthum f. kanehirae TaxID=337451 RepID=A0A3S3NIP3_9MAGN|nr:cytochrome P450 71A1-like protein [Cinnamomum micranthum f. kanehirae]